MHRIKLLKLMIIVKTITSRVEALKPHLHTCLGGPPIGGIVLSYNLNQHCTVVQS